MIDINTLTVGEIAKIEELSGQAITAMGNDDAPKGLMLAALAMIAKRRQDPAFTWNQAQTLTFSEANALIGLSQDDDEEESDAPLEQPAPARSKKKS